MKPKRQWDELTPEEQAQVENTIKAWIEGNVEFKVDPEGRVLMRLKDDGTPESPK